MIQSDFAAPSETGERNAISRIGEVASSIGLSVVDVSGFLEDIVAETESQATAIREMVSRSGSLRNETDMMAEVIQSVTVATTDALSEVENSVASIRNSSERSREVSAWVQKVDGDLTVVDDALGRITQANIEIASIAKQVNILAVNAKIEAARAGEFGRGFSVVAEAINELSKQTASAASGITVSISDLNARIQKLKSEAHSVELSAQQVLKESTETDETLGRMRDGIMSADAAGRRILESGQVFVSHATALDQNIAAVSAGLGVTSTRIDEARRKVGGMVETSEGLIQYIYACGGQNDDAAYIELAQDTSLEVSESWGAALAAGRISEADLFSNKLSPIPGSNPEQFLAPFTRFADETVQDILNAPMQRLERLVGSGVQTVHGYMPTMTSNISKPQSDDPVWNAANCRNRRVWSDRVGTKSGRNTQPFLLQTYRRDMGGGKFTMMNDVSAPITVNGRHWGGVRILFKPSGRT